MSGGYALEASQPKRRGAYRPPEPTGPAGSPAFAQPTAKIPAIRPALRPALRPAAVKPALPIGAPPPAEGKGNCPRPQRLQLPKSKPPLSSQGDAWSTSADPQVEDSSAGAWTTRTGDASTQVSGPPIRGVKRKVESVLSPVNAVNGETLRSQTLRVSTVNSDRNGSFAPPEAAEEGDDEVTNMVLFAKVPKDWTEESATAYCSKFGRLLELKLDHSGALATYESCEAAAKAIAFAKLGAPKPYYPPTKDSLDPEPAEPAEPAESAEPEDQANAYWEEGPTWKPDYPPAKGQGWMDQHVALADAPAEPEPVVPEANAYWEEGATWKPDYPPAKGWNSWDHGDRGNSWDRWDHGDRGNSWDRWDHGDRWDRGNSWDRWDHGDPGAALADTQEETDMVEVEIDEEPKLPEPEDVFLLVRSKGSNQMTTSDVFKVFGKYSLARIRDLDGEAMLEFTALSECISAFNEKQGTSFGRHELQLSGASRDDFQAFKVRQEQRWGGARPPGR